MYQRESHWGLRATVLGLTVAAAALGNAFPSIISSFRMSGDTPPYARGIYYYTDVFGIFYNGVGTNYLYRFTTAGSLISSALLPNANVLGDADWAPPGYPAYGYFGVIDEGTDELKVYTTAGSYAGVARTLSADTVGYGVGGHVVNYIYLGTASGVISCFKPDWNLYNMYSTNVPLSDLAAGRGYGGMWGDFVFLGPSQPPPYVRAYYGLSGYLVGSFALPGNASCGAVYAGWGRSYMWCLRDTGSERWAYQIDTGPLMDIEPASFGSIKALYR